MILRAMAHPGKGVLPDRESPGEPSIISSRHAARAALLPPYHVAEQGLPMAACLSCFPLRFEEQTVRLRGEASHGYFLTLPPCCIASPAPWGAFRVRPPARRNATAGSSLTNPQKL